MSVRAFYHFLKIRTIPRLSCTQIEEIQTKKLRAIVRHAYEETPFYHRFFTESGIDSSSIRTVEDLAKIPRVAKEQIQANFSSFISKRANKRRCSIRTTSGSTGIPTKILYDDNAIALDGAHWTRAYLENGVRLTDTTAFITHPHNFPSRKAFYERFGLVKRVYFSIFDDPKEILRSLERSRPEAIHSYPSSLTILSNLGVEQSCTCQPRTIFTTSELLGIKDREAIRSFFGVEPTDIYGCVELGLMAWQCEEHGGYHINSDSLIMEFLDDNGEAISPGEAGKIICTSLTNFAMPLIRYEIGDIGVREDELCSCGRGLPLLRMVEGRADDLLLSLDGKLLSPRVFYPDPFGGVQEIRQFKIIQEKRDLLKILLKVDNAFSLSSVLDKGEKRIKDLFGSGMRVEFKIVDEIPRDPSGKIKKVLSAIKESEE